MSTTLTLSKPSDPESDSESSPESESESDSDSDPDPDMKLDFFFNVSPGPTLLSSSQILPLLILPTHSLLLILQATPPSLHSSPIFVFSPSRLPLNLSDHDYHYLLRRALDSHLPTLLAAPYHLLLFASPPSSPSALKPLLDAYSLVDHRVRKNLQNLLVLHAPFWSRISAQLLLGPLISPKMASKILWLPHLSALAAVLPIHLICIPPDVYKYDLSLEPSIVVPPDCRQPPVFEVPLSDLIGPHAEHGLPQVVRDCAACIRTSLHQEGLFRRPPALTTTRILRAAYDRGHPVVLSEYPDGPFQAASLLKLFLRLLPVPIIDSNLYDCITSCPYSLVGKGKSSGENQEVVKYIKEKFFAKLEIPQRTILVFTLELLYQVSLHSDSNKMDSINLATCLSPTLLRSNDMIKDMLMCKVSTSVEVDEAPMMSFGNLLRVMIDRFPELCSSQEIESPDQPAQLAHRPPLDADSSTGQRRHASPHALMRPCASPMGTLSMGMRMHSGLGSGVVAVTGVCGVNVFGTIGRGGIGPTFNGFSNRPPGVGLGAAAGGGNAIGIGKCSGLEGELVTTVPVDRGSGCMNTDVD